jgi:hypothetical protein
VIGLIRISLRFAWLAIMVLGIRKVVQMAQSGVDDLAREIEAGNTTGASGTLLRIHEALLKRDHDKSGQEPDVFGKL